MKYLLLFLFFGIVFQTVATAQHPRNRHIVAGEYFLNSDPGQGNGTPLTPEPPGWNFAEVSIALDLNISEGTVIYIRFRNEDGIWSSAQGIKYKKPLPNRGGIIIAGEYSINGTGNPTPMPIDASGNINLSELSLTRNDRVYMRVKDNFERWSSWTSVKYKYKDIRTAQCYIKYHTGTSTPIVQMTIQSQPTPSAFFDAVCDTIFSMTNNTDTVYVRFQSDDYFWGQWRKKDGSIGSLGMSDHNEKLPKEYNLENAYPNPFNPLTTIHYTLSTPALISLKVYNVLGQEVAELIHSREMDEGMHEVQFDASGLTSGVYFYRLNVSQDGISRFSETKKLLLMK
jgi:hypothetical protein